MKTPFPTHFLARIANVSRTSKYDREFYQQLDDLGAHTAHSVLKILFKVIPTPQSAIDVGCGAGTWVQELLNSGVDAHGVDGSWVHPNALVIPPERFQQIDLNQPLETGKRYDLALCLEVAEHLQEERAEAFIQDLTRLSDVILFSAAIPGQGGAHHTNEQWLEYWEEYFVQQGFVGLDLIRPLIWADERIPFWYRQNIMVFCRETQLASLNLEPQLALYLKPHSIIHPTFYSQIYLTFSLRKIAKFFQNMWHAVYLNRRYPERSERLPPKD